MNQASMIIRHFDKIRKDDFNTFVEHYFLYHCWVLVTYTRMRKAEKCCQ
jgi:hypothetical protein